MTRNQYINILEADIEERDEHIAEMKGVMDGFKSEMSTLMRLTERAKAAAQFSVRDSRSLATRASFEASRSLIFAQ